MQTNLIIDQNLQSTTVLTAQEVLARLQKQGFYQTYTTTKGEVKVGGLSPLECQIKENKDGSWKANVSVELASAYSIIPAVILKMVSLLFRVDGAIILLICAAAGLTIANAILADRKAQLSAKLEDALSE